MRIEDYLTQQEVDYLNNEASTIRLQKQRLIISVNREIDSVTGMMIDDLDSEFDGILGAVLAKVKKRLTAIKNIISCRTRSSLIW